jgi:hypothetical protein
VYVGLERNVAKHVVDVQEMATEMSVNYVGVLKDILIMGHYIYR